MKIAYVYDAVYPYETGGVQKRVWELSQRLSRDHEVHWYGLHYWEGPATTERDGVVFHGVMEPCELYVDGRRSIPEAVRYAANLVEPLTSNSFDVIDCQEFPYFPALSCKLGTVTDDSSLVLTWHEVWDNYWYEYLGWKGAFGKLIERTVARLPDEHVAVSGQTRDQVLDLGVPDASVVPNGISFDELQEVEPAPEPVDVVYIGRLIEQKRTKLVVDAIANLIDCRPDLRCKIVGNGPRCDAVERTIAKHGLETNVTVHDPFSAYEDVIGLMKAADVLALPSRREGFGITALEALAVGTPVVTTAHPRNAVEDLVVDGVNGFVTDATPESLAEGIRNAWSVISPEACIDSARPFDWDRVAELTQELYQTTTLKGSTSGQARLSTD